MNSVSSPVIVGLGGSSRAHSSTQRALEYALGIARDLGARTEMLTPSNLELPLFEPEALNGAAGDLLEVMAAADGVIIASPAYHGGPSGWVKNALDYLEGLREDQRPYLDERAVGCIVCAPGAQAPTSTLISLRSVVHALRGWPTPLGVIINPSASANGTFELTEMHRTQLGILATQVVTFATKMAHAR